MDSVTSIDLLTQSSASLRLKLEQYQSCLKEFDSLDYSDAYVTLIRQEMQLLEALLQNKLSDENPLENS
ncbi:hypothetical protein LZP73_17040 [Shewanella sp. AS16]|uniref:hypothetical protein n=1 Tax=Shewanella sp. AS16 TaxID=2907625 RepID=UPI001F37014F|nr:hypothetical protein [Shewanella sp. AS16]MCE9687888.1 hypothetical protein [Shewanella sp. AS16]